MSKLSVSLLTVLLLAVQVSFSSSIAWAAHPAVVHASGGHSGGGQVGHSGGYSGGGAHGVNPSGYSGGHSGGGSYGGYSGGQSPAHGTSHPGAGGGYHPQPGGQPHPQPGGQPHPRPGGQPHPTPGGQPPHHTPPPAVPRPPILGGGQPHNPPPAGTGRRAVVTTPRVPPTFRPILPSVTSSCYPVLGVEPGRHHHPDHCRYYDGYCWRGIIVSIPFYAFEDYVPTEKFYDQNDGTWTNPTTGETSTEPPAESETYSIPVVETVQEEEWSDSLNAYVPVTRWDADQGAYVPVTRQEVWHYDVSFYPDEGKDGYTDFRGTFNFLEGTRATSAPDPTPDPAPQPETESLPQDSY